LISPCCCARLSHSGPLGDTDPIRGPMVHPCFALPPRVSFAVTTQTAGTHRTASAIRCFLGRVEGEPADNRNDRVTARVPSAAHFS
jgi:hypothetical protein